MVRRILSIGAIINQPANYNPRFYSGAGVQMGGANTTAVRRALKRRANKPYHPGEQRGGCAATSGVGRECGSCCTPLSNPADLAFPPGGQRRT